MEDILEQLGNIRKMKTDFAKNRKILKEGDENTALLKELEQAFTKEVSNLSSFENFYLSKKNKRVEWSGYVKIDVNIFWQIIFEDGQAKSFINFDDRAKKEIVGSSSSVYTKPLELTEEVLKFLFALYNFVDTTFKNKIEKEI